MHREVRDRDIAAAFVVVQFHNVGLLWTAEVFQFALKEIDRELPFFARKATLGAPCTHSRVSASYAFTLAVPHFLTRNLVAVHSRHL